MVQECGSSLPLGSRRSRCRDLSLSQLPSYLEGHSHLIAFGHVCGFVNTIFFKSMYTGKSRILARALTNTWMIYSNDILLNLC